MNINYIRLKPRVILLNIIIWKLIKCFFLCVFSVYMYWHCGNITRNINFKFHQGFYIVSVLLKLEFSISDYYYFFWDVFSKTLWLISIKLLEVTLNTILKKFINGFWSSLHAPRYNNFLKCFCLFTIVIKEFIKNYYNFSDCR